MYDPLEDNGLIGNLETCALVSRTGSIDWCCFPHLESPSLFAALLDEDRGGCFAIQPAGSFESTQRYFGRTNILRTTFRTDSGTLTIIDFMPVSNADSGQNEGRDQHRSERLGKSAIYRRVTCISGTVDIDITFSPRFDYARSSTTVEPTDNGVIGTGNGERAVLSSPVELWTTETEPDAFGSASLEESESVWFVLQYENDETPTPDACERVLDETIDYWRNWSHMCDVSKCVFGGPWHERAVRSALVLKLLIHHETGAIAAAPTTSLPEEIGGVRNWDYRFNWIRDAAFTVQALVHLGHTKEASSYFEWFLDICRSADPAHLQPLYGLHGETDLVEEELTHLSGYRDSSPVRIGNGAATQRQNDVYGELVLAIYEMLQYTGSLTEEDWNAIRNIVEYVCEVWDEPDEGIWEVRRDQAHYVFSKVMCWVALDRGIAMARQRGFDAHQKRFDAPIEHWREHRDAIKATVLEKGFSEEVNSFTQSFGDSATLDATGLLIPIVGFLPFDDPRVQGTIDATIERLDTDGLVKRYTGDDGLSGEEGAFVLCSFWLVDALALSGRVEEATDRFLDLLEYVSPQGLVAEEVDPDSGTMLGNFPQAFSHIGLINSALYLGEIEDGGRKRRVPKPTGLRLGSGHVLESRRSLWSSVVDYARNI